MTSLGRDGSGSVNRIACVVNKFHHSKPIKPPKEPFPKRMRVAGLVFYRCERLIEILLLEKGVQRVTRKGFPRFRLEPIDFIKKLPQILKGFERICGGVPTFNV